ncbi:MAG: hypothetical protein GWP10_22270 [Nitrospiraceae bacterium]|nr:hypothetical protein [Nitrospiraceae bacterium]
MRLPDLLIYETEEEYWEYYREEYCHKGLVTFDEIRVYFKQNKFYHAFYESRNRDGNKDQFSKTRARRMGWIRATLENANSDLFQGWDNKRKRYDPGRRVCVVYESFVVILKMWLKMNRTLKSEFITCYQADNSIGKIKNSPRWSKEECLEALNKKGR